MKRTVDILASLTALLLLWPVMCLVAVVVWLDRTGPVFYTAQRIGLAGKPFRMWKFRTMVTGADREGPTSTPADDPRVTPCGAFLRRHKLDELPQLFNVLAGHMSLVGPRPQVAWAVKEYTTEEAIVLSVRPGITDPASLRFHNEGELLRGSEDPDRDYWENIHPAKMRLSINYARHHTLMGDLAILWSTFSLLFKQEVRP